MEFVVTISFTDGIRPLHSLLDFGMNQGAETGLLVMSCKCVPQSLNQITPLRRMVHSKTGVLHEASRAAGWPRPPAWLGMFPTMRL